MKIILNFLIISFIFSCGSSKYVEDINIDMDDISSVYYGNVIKLNSTISYSNGKTKKAGRKDNLIINVIGGSYSNGNITIDNYPSNFDQNSITVQATYTNKDINLSKELTIPFNYESDLKLDFRGEHGEHGIDGKE